MTCQESCIHTEEIAEMRATNRHVLETLSRMTMQLEGVSAQSNKIPLLLQNQESFLISFGKLEEKLEDTRLRHFTLEKRVSRALSVGYGIWFAILVAGKIIFDPYIQEYHTMKYRQDLLFQQMAVAEENIKNISQERKHR